MTLALIVVAVILAVLFFISPEAERAGRCFACALLILYLVKALGLAHI